MGATEMIYSKQIFRALFALYILPAIVQSMKKERSPAQDLPTPYQIAKLIPQVAKICADWINQNCKRDTKHVQNLKHSLHRGAGDSYKKKTWKDIQAWFLGKTSLYIRFKV